MKMKNHSIPVAITAILILCFVLVWDNAQTAGLAELNNTAQNKVYDEGKVLVFEKKIIQGWQMVCDAFSTNGKGDSTNVIELLFFRNFN